MRATRSRRVRRPAPRFPLTRVYEWKTVVVKVWWPVQGEPPAWSSRAPGH